VSKTASASEEAGTDRLLVGVGSRGRRDAPRAPLPRDNLPRQIEQHRIPDARRGCELAARARRQQKPKRLIRFQRVTVGQASQVSR
jgi:hypothetical protein